MTSANPSIPISEAEAQLDRFVEWAEENAVEGAAEAATATAPTPIVARLLSE